MEQLIISTENYRFTNGPVVHVSSSVFLKGTSSKIAVPPDGRQMPKADSRSLQ